MRHLAAALALLSLLSARPASACDAHDNADDCKALTAFAKSTNLAGWHESTGWLTKRSVCSWYGVKCAKKADGSAVSRRHHSGGRVTELSLRDNDLRGSIPAEIGLLSSLSAIDLHSARPANYRGCNGTNLQKSPLPPAFFQLRQLQKIDLEYTCLGGTLEGFGNLTQMRSLQLHGNYISGPIPQAMDAMKDIEVFKLGRNPISGTLPLIRTFSKVVQFNCNFCALSGAFPDTIFDYMPSLQVSYWDGNGFTGSLPSSVARSKKLQRLSFNINHFTGRIPPGICDIPAGDGDDTPGTAHDCRIGADTDLTAYQADYPWILKGPGNLYDCEGMPRCAQVGSCNKTKGTKVVNPVSPVRCK